MIRRKGHLTTYYDAHWMGGEIKSLLAADCKHCTANAASTIKSYLSNSVVKETWSTLKGWYRLAEDQPPPACPETMVKQMAEHVELYARAPPMGEALLFNFLHFKISNDMPTDAELQKVVGGLRNE